MAARPDIDARTEQLVSKGRWMVPGYKVCTVLFHFLFRSSKGNSHWLTNAGKIWGSLVALRGEVGGVHCIASKSYFLSFLPIRLPISIIIQKL